MEKVYVLRFSDRFFSGFLLDPNYLDRFSFFGHLCRLEGESRLRAELLLDELIQNGSMAPDLVRVLLLQLFFLMEESSIVVSVCDMGGNELG